MTKLAALGSMAKLAIAGTTAVVGLGVAGAAAGVLPVPGAGPAVAQVAHGAGVTGGVAVEPSPNPAVAGPSPLIALPAGTGPAPAPVAASKAPPTTAARPVTATPTTRPSAAAPTVVSPASAAVPGPALAPATVARRTPSAAEVQQAIKTFPQYVHTFITPTAGQVAQLGDKVCTAFDEGQTFAQVKATGLSMVTQVPRTTVLPGGADWVVRTVVGLYCPGHGPKLV